MSLAAGPSMRTAVSRQRDAMPLQNAGRPFAPTPTPPVIPMRRIDDEQLAMVARNEAEPAAEARRVEDRDLDAGVSQSARGTRATCRGCRSSRAAACTRTPRCAARVERGGERGRRRRRSGRCSSRARWSLSRRRSSSIIASNVAGPSRSKLTRLPLETSAAAIRQRPRANDGPGRAASPARVLGATGQSAKLRVSARARHLQDMCARWPIRRTSRQDCPQPVYTTACSTST